MKSVLVGLPDTDEAMCFSLVAPARTLDLICGDTVDANIWITTLNLLIATFRREGKFNVDP
jgi:hypothetical protein